MAKNPKPSLLDLNKIFQQVYDEENDRLRTDSSATIVTPPAIEVAISATNDNIAISDGNDTLAINSDGSINVNITDSGSITIDADIRDLTHVSDSIKIGDGTDFLTVNNDGSLNITDNGSSLTVDSVDLDIRNLNSSQDNVAISDGSDILSVNNDGSINITDNGGSLTVDAINLDIRDLTHVSDSLKIGDGTNFAQVTVNNELKSFDQTTHNKLDNLISSSVNLETIIQNELDETQSILNDIKTTITDIDLNTDTLETLIGSTNTKLDLVTQEIQDKTEIKVLGTEDGTIGGTQRAFVNNLKLQILDAHDREQTITYADPGTKNQRITQIDYSSSIINGSVVARKSISYQFINNRYIPEQIIWSIV